MVLQLPQDAHSRAVPALTSQTASTQKLDGTAASAASTAFAAETIVRIAGEEAFYYDIGTAPVATSSTALVPAGVMFEERIPGLQKIAVLKAASATSGIVHVTPLL